VEWAAWEWITKRSLRASFHLKNQTTNGRIKEFKSRIMKQKRQKGFTLIELLVVIAIIGILTFVIFINVGSSRVKARDGERLADLHQIQSALEIYNADCGQYPDVLDATASAGCIPPVTLADFMQTVPRDPLTGPYDYHYDSSDDSYVINFTLETQMNDLAPGSHTVTKDGIH
jgi:general secretion pathway protein G